MEFKIEVLLKVYDDVSDAYNYYQNKKEGLGDKFYLDFYNQITKLSINPFYYGSYKSSFRRIAFKFFPYIIIYFIEEDRRVTIHSVRYAGKDPKNIESKLGIN
jgi:toxin ParE1/3/4